MKILRLIILVAGCVLLAFGLRLLYLRYYPDSSHEDKPVSIKITRSSSDQSGIGPPAAGLRKGKEDDTGSSSEVPDSALPLAPSPAPPVLTITTAKLPMGAVDVAYRQALKASGLTGTGVWKVIKGDLPPGLTFGRDGVLSGLPEKEGEWRFTVQVEDGKGDSARKEFRLLVRPPPREEQEEGALSILTTTIADGSLGREYLQKIESEGGEPPYEWALAGGVLPELIHLNKQSGVLYGTPREVGRFQFTLRLTDNSGNFVENNFTLEVREGEIEIVTDALPPAVKEEKYSLTFRARGGVVPYRWEVVTGRLPRGLKFDPERGILSGIPEKWETSIFLIRVTGQEGRSAEKEFTLEVMTDSYRTVSYHGLRIVTAQLPSAVRGQLYTEQLTAADGSPPYIWTISRGDLPPSLSLESDTARISGIPEQAGRSVFTVLVSDTERQVDQKEFTLTVDYQLVYITTGSLPPAVAGEPYSQSIEATGGTPPYTFSLESGDLPDGLSFDAAAGEIRGTVSDIYLGQGTQEFIFRIKAADQAGHYDIVELRLTVRETAQPTPLFSPTPPPVSSPTPAFSPVGLHISTSSLPDGVVGENYNQTLAGLGGIKPYAWSMNNLPPGLSGSSSGTISGVPEIAADYSVDISVTDTDGAVASKTLTLTVRESHVEGVSDLTGAPGDGKAGLAWTNPAGSDFKRVRVLRKTGGYPQAAGDGVVVYEGTGDNIIDQGLTNSIPYFYAVITYNQEGSPGGIGLNNRIEIIPLAVSLSGENDPYADEVISFSPLSPGGFGSSSMPDIVLGSPRGEGKDQGSLDVVSLHARIYDGTTPCGGSIILKFNDNLVWDGDGADFTIFENVFDIGGDEAKRWMEPAIVAVSQDGKTYYTFPYDYVPHDDGDEIDYFNPYSYMDGDGKVRGFAGIHPVFSNNGTPDPTNPSVSGGDSFDLSDITGKDLAWIQYIKITATGDGWLTDSNGDSVRHVQEMGACGGAGSSGFDLDAVSAVNY